MQKNINFSYDEVVTSLFYTKLQNMYFKLTLQNGLQEGMVYAVEFSHRSGRDLINMAKKRTNVVPIIEDARHPHKYRFVIINK